MFPLILVIYPLDFQAKGPIIDDVSGSPSKKLFQVL